MVVHYLSTDHSLEDNVSIRIPHRVDHSRTIDEVDPTHQSNVLPHLQDMKTWNDKYCT